MSETLGTLAKVVRSKNAKPFRLTFDVIFDDAAVADLFDWQPACRYDVVFFSFWLSHVPRARFAAFWELVRSSLAPNGRVFLIDNRNDPLNSPHIEDPYVVEYAPDLHLRRLSDGTQWRVGKVMYEPEELQGLVAAAGWDVPHIARAAWLIERRHCSPKQSI